MAEMLSIEDYGMLRRASRDVLYAIGVPSNPGFTDHNIISALRSAVGLPKLEPWDEWDESASFYFRDQLAEVAQLKPPFSIGDVALELEHIVVVGLHS